MEALTTVLPIIIDILLIILLIVGIIFVVKCINIINRANRIIEDVENKIESLNPIFNIAATISNSIEYVSETVASTIKK